MFKFYELRLGYDTLTLPGRFIVLNVTMKPLIGYPNT